MHRPPHATFALRRPGRHAAILLLALSLGACGGGGAPATTPTPAPATTLTLSSSAPQAHAGDQPLALTATLDGAGAVNWQLAPGSVGGLSAASGATVNYLPPAQLTAPVQVIITASSGGLSKNIVLQLLPPPGLSLIAGDVGGRSERDGAGTGARFTGIVAAARDGAGNLYVAENDSLTPAAVRKIAVDGTVTTLTHGSLLIGGDNAYAAFVSALSMAPDGSLYLLQRQVTFLSGSLETYTTYLRKLSADGSLSTIARVPDTIFPQGVVAASDGSVYLVGVAHIGRLAADGSYQVLAGAPGQSYGIDVDGAGADARFGIIRDVAAGPDGALVVADQQGVRLVSKAGVVTTLASTGPGPTDGDSASAHLRGPRSLALEAGGAVLVLDRANDGGADSYEVRRIVGGAIHTLQRQNDPAGLWSGQCGRAGAQDTLLRMGADGALLAVNAAAVVRLDADGTRHPVAGLDNSSGVPIDGQGAAARYCDPGLLAADRDGNLYSLDGAANDARHFLNQMVVRKTTPSGQVSTLAQTAPGKPTGIVVDAAGRLLVSVWPLGDNGLATEGGVVYWLRPDGSLSVVAGQSGPNGATPLQQDGDAATARFGGPALLGADADGNVYLADRDVRYSAHTTYRKLSAQGTVSTIASLPPGLNAAPDGYVYGADPSARVLYRIAPDGSRSDLAGSGDSGYFGALPVPFDYRTPMVPIGPHSFAVIAGSAVLRLTLP